jgi:2-polyprenyl-3-methyl-5-hydroxy-6-metoxy-1,4-benzoquinol methylase
MDSKRHKYEYKVKLDADSGPARVVRLVGNNKDVLEIGCGPGSITKLLSSVSKCRVTALDIDAESIEKIAPFCENAYQADLNDPDWLNKLDKSAEFDVLVAADVLEHVYHPLEVLSGMKGLLKDQGYMVISIPHVGHSVIHACLLDEDFEYNDFGLLDKTHIRFFGIKNIQKLFDDAQMKIIHAEFVVRSPEHTEFSKRWAKMSNNIKDALAENPFGLVYQVIIKAVPISAEGEAVDLMNMTVEPHSPSFRDSVRAYARLYLSESIYTKLLQVYELRHKLFVRTKS